MKDLMDDLWNNLRSFVCCLVVEIQNLLLSEGNTSMRSKDVSKVNKPGNDLSQYQNKADTNKGNGCEPDVEVHLRNGQKPLGFRSTWLGLESRAPM